MKWIIFASFLALAGCLWEETESSLEESSYLPLDDSEYPYAGVPRLVIETENFKDIRDRETKVPARLQIYGEDSPSSEILELTVRGRGNSTFHAPKYGIKLEFSKKTSLLGMPKDKDWALRSNYGDKTLLRDFMMNRLANRLGVSYVPRMRYVELYLNREYKGLYLLTETVKSSKNRVPLSKSDSSFLFEKEDSKKIDDPYFETRDGNLIHIQEPKQLSEKSLQMAKDHLDDFEVYLHRQNFWGVDSLSNWLDIRDFLEYYWVQEFAKNEDGKFTRSVFFYWEKGGTIHFGPLWDFDLGFGNESREKFAMPENWFIRNYRWNRYILMDARMQEMAKEYWTAHRETFHELIDSIPLYKSQIEKAAKNDIKRWPILDNTFLWALRHSYDSYDEAVDSMTVWMEKRFQWIENNL
ncbi:MAG: CotH kinase family protein [Fibrobacter sp.]|nr:CotH kinase family protein [Fibrobacter sp.]MDY6369804.1 CotH kinase family protein [Fibrobacter sp.]MDY6390654.1 CotH kinase family protein [Fibrobacter sp.]